MRTGAAGALLALGFVLGGGVSASGAGLAADVDGASEQASQGTTASGVELAGTGVGFLALGAGAVIAAQRRRWRSGDTSVDISTGIPTQDTTTRR